MNPGDVLRYDTLTRPNRWCREGMAIVRKDGRAVDTYWRGGGDEHVLTDDERATATVLFHLADYRELDRHQGHTWQDYHPSDRQVVTSQHGLQRRLFVRVGAVPDHGTKVENAREKVAEAERQVESARWHLDLARRDLAALTAAAAPVPAPATDGPPSAPTEGGPGLCANHWPTEEADCPTCGPQAPAEAACYRVNTPHVAHPWMVDGKTWQCPGILRKAAESVPAPVVPSDGSGQR